MTDTKNVIFVEKPYVVALKTGYLKIRCSTCFAPTTNLCPKCRNVVYCDDRCLNYDRNMHQIECCFLQKCLPGTDVRFLARFIMRQQYDQGRFPESTRLPVLSTLPMKERTTTDLIAHYRASKRSKVRHLALEIMWQNCETAYVDTPLAALKKSDAQRAMCVLLTNSFGIAGYGLSNPNKICVIGSGLYLSTSLFDHSCDADLHVAYCNNQVVIKVKKDETFEAIDSMTKEEFARLTVNYGRQTAKACGCNVALTCQRKKRMKEDYFFECRCSICGDRTARALEERSSTYECPKCKKPFIWRRRSVGLHRSCKCTVDPPVVNRDHWEMAQAAVDTWKNIMYTTEFETDGDKIMSACERFAVMIEKFWHPIVNLRFGQMKERLVVTYLTKFHNGDLNEIERRRLYDKLLFWSQSMDQTYALYGGVGQAYGYVRQRAAFYLGKDE